MGGEEGNSEAESSQTNDEGDIKILGRTIPEWAASPAPDRAMIADHIYWTWYGKTYPKAAPQKQDVPGEKPIKEKTETPSKRWWIESPQDFQADEPDYLCETCRHIDFKYLINSPLLQALEEIPLSSLTRVLENENCAFCRLVAFTIRARVGGSEIDTIVDEKPVMCSMRTVPIESDTKGPRQLLLSGLPTPNKIDGPRMIYCLNPKDEPSVSEVNGPRSVTIPHIKYDLVKKWYNDCNDGNCGLNPSKSYGREMPKSFRLIDVDSDCIVHAVQKPRYVALSYVWDAARALRNTNDIRKDLEVKGSLLKRAEELPNTIKDAISLTQQLGEQYLWVDSLCVIQDDPDDQAQQIAAMDLIYSCAVLTIVAALGDTADAHLAGMTSNPREFRQHIEMIQGINLANRPVSFGQAIDQSVWNSRA